jgi:hypothetical protein
MSFCIASGFLRSERPQPLFKFSEESDRLARNQQHMELGCDCLEFCFDPNQAFVIE